MNDIIIYTLIFISGIIFGFTLVSDDQDKADEKNLDEEVVEAYLIYSFIL